MTFLLLSCISDACFQNLGNFLSLFFDIFFLKLSSSHWDSNYTNVRLFDILCSSYPQPFFFSLLFRWDNFCWFVLNVLTLSLSVVCYSVHLESIWFWLLYFSVLKFPFGSFHIFSFFAETFYLSIHFKTARLYFLDHFYHSYLKVIIPKWCHLSIGVCHLFFLMWVDIFLNLYMMSNFGLHL